MLPHSFLRIGVFEAISLSISICLSVRSFSSFLTSSTHCSYAIFGPRNAEVFGESDNGNIACKTPMNGAK